MSSSYFAKHVTPEHAVSTSQWIPDSAVTQCTQCTHKFTLLNRKHHCRQCGHVFCSKCSSKRLPLKSMLERVCDGCYRGLTSRPRISSREHAGSFSGSSTSSSTSSSSSTPKSTVLSPEQRAQEATEKVLYRSASVCARCAMIDRTGFHLQPCVLFEQYRGIWLKVECKKHGPYITLICKDSKFYNRMKAYDEIPTAFDVQQKLSSLNLVDPAQQAANAQADPSQSQPGMLVKDIEDLGKYLELKKNPDLLPLSFELNVFRDEALLADEEIDLQLTGFTSNLPKGHTFVLKVVGGLVEKKDIASFNQKVHRIYSMILAGKEGLTSSPLHLALASCRLLIDLSYERLLDLCALDNSVLLKPRVFPCVRYFLSEGEEQLFVDEMNNLVKNLDTISDIQLIVQLSIEPPYPNMKPIMEFIKAQVGMIRYVVINRERSPGPLFGRLREYNNSIISTPTSYVKSRTADSETDPSQATSTSSASSPSVSSSSSFTPPPSHPSTSSSPWPDLSEFPETADPVGFLEHLEKCTGGHIRPKDFVPLNVGQVFEPVLNNFGYGQYNFKSSFFCAFATTLVNTDSLNSVPVSRLFDTYQLYGQLYPISQRIKNEGLGLTSVRAIQKVLKQCAFTAHVPDLASYIFTTDKSRHASAAAFYHRLQTIIVHNRMDFASIDFSRRCKCGALQPSPFDPTKAQIASCTGCL